MEKIPGPNRLLYPLLSFLLVIFTACGLSGCGHEEEKGVFLPLPNDTVVAKHAIPIELARELTARFRASVDSFNRNCPTFKDSMLFGHAESFPTDVFVKLLTQHNEKQGYARGVRVYFGRGAAGEIKMVLVPYDSSGNDMIDNLADINGKPAPGTTLKKNEAQKAASGQVIEDGQRCPTICDAGASGLN
jgi:hypothetical protein